jgi:hypothetical protein
MSTKPKAQLAKATANPLAPSRRTLVDEVATMAILPVLVKDQKNKASFVPRRKEF